MAALELRHLVRPFDATKNLLEQAVPMSELMGELRGQLRELRAFKEAADMVMMGA